MLRLVCYDIENDKYRNKLAKKLEAFGFERVQRSVFCGSHPLHQWEKCRSQLLAFHEKYGKEDDKIYVMVISPRMLKAMFTVGKPPDIDRILDKIVTFWV
ncbi:MAG: CRISPR-associated endonuclease Cas2 [Ferruginibacter sp.]